MFSTDQYQLLDFGDGRRLERFGERIVDRACPSAEGISKATPKAWSQADGVFTPGENDQGHWTFTKHPPELWLLRHAPFAFQLQTTPAGQLGIFPEQAKNWDWIARQVGRASRQPTVLNLFAYTGGSTMAAAAAGAKVVHIDAAKNVVAWARRNAEFSGLTDKPIRWIAEDAVKFVHRELRRGNRYDAVILDPPSYGHGPSGEVWQLIHDLPELLQLCVQLMDGRGLFLLLTCHTLGVEADHLRDLLGDLTSGKGSVSAGTVGIRSAAGRRLPAGVAARWDGTPES